MQSTISSKKRPTFIEKKHFIQWHGSSPWADSWESSVTAKRFIYSPGTFFNTNGIFQGLEY